MCSYSSLFLNCSCPWSFLKDILTFKLNRIILNRVFDEIGPDPSENNHLCHILLKRLGGFSNAPFTVQRLCELLDVPRMHYKREDKYLRALEKVLMVVSVVDSQMSTKSKVQYALPVVAASRSEENEEDSTETTHPSRKRSVSMETVEFQEADSTIEDKDDVDNIGCHDSNVHLCKRVKVCDNPVKMEDLLPKSLTPPLLAKESDHELDHC